MVLEIQEKETEDLGLKQSCRKHKSCLTCLNTGKVDRKTAFGIRKCSDFTNTATYSCIVPKLQAYLQFVPKV